MPYVPGFDYDIFISYAGDDYDSRWISSSEGLPVLQHLLWRMFEEC
ncbi:hypothetical protein GRAN_4862 [Granulicella sibirica]|uniref:TIR domain-containing protein n=1 Tax=Granulicella sibirica TaxID=2479048 RepID=A0A4Q0SYE2_9BACT|nr:hypothetical protein GRAN_4862 [Granulicella sibirica]